MKLFLVLLTLPLLVAACHPRVSLYSPRRERTEAHLQAATAADCLGCHDISRRPHHRPDDDCFHCHKICEVY